MANLTHYTLKRSFQIDPKIPTLKSSHCAKFQTNPVNVSKNRFQFRVSNRTLCAKLAFQKFRDACHFHASSRLKLCVKLQKCLQCHFGEISKNECCLWSTNRPFGPSLGTDTFFQTLLWDQTIRHFFQNLLSSIFFVLQLSSFMQTFKKNYQMVNEF